MGNFPRENRSRNSVVHEKIDRFKLRTRTLTRRKIVRKGLGRERRRVEYKNRLRLSDQGAKKTCKTFFN